MQGQAPDQWLLQDKTDCLDEHVSLMLQEQPQVPLIFCLLHAPHRTCMHSSRPQAPGICHQCHSVMPVFCHVMSVSCWCHISVMSVPRHTNSRSMPQVSVTNVIVSCLCPVMSCLCHVSVMSVPCHTHSRPCPTPVLSCPTTLLPRKLVCVSSCFHDLPALLLCFFA
jgi:hypothetical protein